MYTGSISVRVGPRTILGRSRLLTFCKGFYIATLERSFVWTGACIVGRDFLQCRWYCCVLPLDMTVNQKVGKNGSEKPCRTVMNFGIFFCGWLVLY